MITCKCGMHFIPTDEQVRANHLTCQVCGRLVILTAPAKQPEASLEGAKVRRYQRCSDDCNCYRAHARLAGDVANVHCSRCDRLIETVPVTHLKGRLSRKTPHVEFAPKSDRLTRIR